jgi:hypothetical protein
MELPKGFSVMPEQGAPAPTTRYPAGEHILEIAVIFTAVEQTREALRAAASLAEGLNALIHIIVPQIVPYPLPLEKPPVARDSAEKRFFAVARESRVETKVRIYLCRDRWEMLKLVLRPHSTVVIGGRKRWWPTSERRLAAKLRRAGHEVLFTEKG